MKRLRVPKNKGQIILYFVLQFSFFFMLFAAAYNIGQVVHRKIRIQQITDIASHSGASVIAHAMANTDGALNSIAEYNERITRKYFEFLDEVSLVNCSESSIALRVNNPGIPMYHCSSKEISHTPRPCDSDFKVNDVYVHTRGENALSHIEFMANHYYGPRGEITNLHMEILSLITNATRRSQELIWQNIKSNLPRITPKDIYVHVSPIKVIPEQRTIAATFHYGRKIGTVCDVNEVTSASKLLQASRRLMFEENNGNGYVLVGINDPHRRRNDSEPQKAVTYVNWENAFGNISSPLIQAFSAAAPFRNVLEAKRTASNLWTAEKTAYIEGLSDRDNRGMIKFSGEILSNIGEDDLAKDALKTSNPPYHVRWIPLSGDTYIRPDTGDMASLYGSENPIKSHLGAKLFAPTFDFGRWHQSYQNEVHLLSRYGVDSPAKGYMAFRH